MLGICVLVAFAFAFRAFAFWLRLRFVRFGCVLPNVSQFSVLRFGCVLKRLCVLVAFWFAF